jgi:NAD(P)-dependent dehydrogenase (short-subunit alcohol dehydrogenase family)
MNMTEIDHMFSLDGRVALVTGGAGLLGEQFCRTLARAGAQVIVADIDIAATENLAVDINRVSSESLSGEVHPGVSAVGIEVDITSTLSVQGLVDKALRSFSKIDILVNSAAIDPKVDPKNAFHTPIQMGAFEEYPLEMWNQALAVNLTGMFLTTQAVVKTMLAQGRGVIINLCSIYGLVGPDQRIYHRDGQPNVFKPVYYSVTKAGVLGFTRYLATYYADQNIRVNALTPGGIYNGHDDDFVRAYSARTVFGRMAQKDEMNGALLFLASDASEYMTGANLVVDGGWTAW